ncbi:hypothetical protein [Candidatus Synchoanobacter obligatus]|uniref:Uncharacterized protein n=1 Tax=Candidatus Synchoanobacter obligatus TaxID=2919597 RepID=A0ABT1L3Z9_9GAMM|nr:hypothetical protein [Candidatus Synchoanobacter obligatus]MCP8351696.1 hypothetical protein [Candidatus Synchoanobacter obligatus]
MYRDYVIDSYKHFNKTIPLAIDITKLNKTISTSGQLTRVQAARLNKRAASLQKAISDANTTFGMLALEKYCDLLTADIPASECKLTQDMERMHSHLDNSCSALQDLASCLEDFSSAAKLLCPESPNPIDSDDLRDPLEGIPQEAIRDNLSNGLSPLEGIIKLLR